MKMNLKKDNFLNQLSYYFDNIELLKLNYEKGSSDYHNRADSNLERCIS